MHVRFRATPAALSRQKYHYAMASVQLAKRYEAHGPGSRAKRAKRDLRRLRRHAGKWLKVGAQGLALVASGRTRDPRAMAALRWNLASAAGMLAGMVKYRSL